MTTRIKYPHPCYCRDCKDWTLRLRAIPGVTQSDWLWVWLCECCGRYEQP
jgi:hypothetical protein